MIRKAEIKRKTKETDIVASLCLDGSGKSDIDTGIGFFDHMLDCFTRHGLFDLTLKCKGDLNVDGHHTVEDTGIVLGDAIKTALGAKEGIKRYGSFILPMDDALVLSAVDLSGRAYLSYDLKFFTDKCGEMETALCREFFLALTSNALINLHLRGLAGVNDHHIMEAAFKSFAKSLREAVTPDDRISGVLSTKGTL